MVAPENSFLGALAAQAAGMQAPPQTAPAGYLALADGQPSGSSTNALQTIMSILSSQQAGGAGGGGGGGMNVPGSSVGGIQFGNAFNPNQDLMTRDGVTLQDSVMQDLLGAGQAGHRILDAIGGGYRSIAAQRALYQQYLNGTHPALVAPPGHSYHNYGAAFDLDQHLGPHLVNVLQQLGFRNDVPGEWWHWSIGNAPWGGN